LTSLWNQVSPITLFIGMIRDAQHKVQNKDNENIIDKFHW